MAFPLPLSAGGSWLLLLLYSYFILPTKAWDKGSPFGGENSDTSICISISLWFCLPLHLCSAPCLWPPRSSQQSRQLGGNDPISRATGTGLSPECPRLTEPLLFLHNFLSVCFLSSACPLPGKRPKKSRCGTSRVLPAGFTTAGGFLAFQFQEQPSKLALP